MMTKARAMLVVVLLGCFLPALVTAKTALLGACGDGVQFSDGLIQTQEGINLMNKLSNLKLVAWDQDPADKDVTCLTLSITGHNLTFNFKNKGAAASIIGAIDVVHNNGKNNYLDIDTRSLGKKVPAGMFQENNGLMMMYIQHLYPNEVTIKTCRNRFLSATESYYVFSSVDYSRLRTKCIEETSGAFAGFDMKMAPACV